MSLAISFSDIEAAAKRIEGIAHRTPVLTSRTADEIAGAQLFFKCENFQRMGAFKFRGAYNALAQFTPEQRKAGVCAFSSGNHAQGIALSAQLLGIPATIVMPLDSPAVKLAATRGYGAEVITYDRYKEDRIAIGNKLAQERGMTLIPPYDHAHVMAGQGTAALELLQETANKGVQLDTLLVCLGGGGLISGCAVAAKHLNPKIKVIGVEPEAGNDAQQSKRAGKIISIDTPKTIADGAQTQFVGKLTFPVIQELVDDIVTVSDAQLIEAMRFAASRMKMVIEPTGGLAMAAAMQGAVNIQGQRVGVIISGGNVDIAQLAQYLA
jgi:threo-3-hydroxy-L-aspartate ammonia-lyase